MASTYTPLGVELQATGENAGTWGTKTNTNLQIIEQVAGGYTTQAVSDSGDTTLSVSDGSTGATLSNAKARRTMMAGHKSAVSFASQISKTEPLRNQTDFGDIVRGLAVYGRKVVKNDALVTAIVGSAT